MSNFKQLVDDAHSAFVSKDYTRALFLFGHLSSLYPSNEEYKLCAIFCDISSENEEKAHALYDYLAIAKSDDKENAIQYVYDLIEAYDGDQAKMMDILKDLTTQSVESLEAIQYEDFIKLVESRGSFRIAFEDIMFSTKIALESKEDFFNFVEQLIDNGFNTTAYTYLDSFNEYFSYDSHIEELYKKLDEKTIENKNK